MAFLKKKKLPIETLNLEGEEVSYLRRVNRLKKLVSKREQKEAFKNFKEKEKRDMRKRDVCKKYKDAPFDYVRVFRIYSNNLKFPITTAFIPPSILASAFVITPNAFIDVILTLLFLASLFLTLELTRRFQPSLKIFPKFYFKKPLSDAQKLIFNKTPTYVIEKKIIKKLNKCEKNLLKRASFDDLIEVLEADE